METIQDRIAVYKKKISEAEISLHDWKGFIPTGEVLEKITYYMEEINKYKLAISMLMKPPKNIFESKKILLKKIKYLEGELKRFQKEEDNGVDLSHEDMVLSGVYQVELNIKNFYLKNLNFLETIN